MMNKHAKSPCCNASVRRYGQRRRQCILCFRTWRVRKKQRGRKRSRTNQSLLISTFLHRETLIQRAKRSKLSSAVIQKRHRHQLNVYLKRDAPGIIPEGKLILLIDGIWFLFKNTRWVIYLRAIRSVKNDVAVFLDPVFLPGRENFESWECVCGQIAPDVRKRIVAIIADGFRGVETLAAENGWILQRCHFHLIAELQRMRGKWKYVKGKEIRERLYRLIRAALETTDERYLEKLIREIVYLSNH